MLGQTLDEAVIEDLRSSRPLQFYRRVRKTANNDYKLRRFRPSVCQSVHFRQSL